MNLTSALTALLPADSCHLRATEIGRLEASRQRDGESGRQLESN